MAPSLNSPVILTLATHTLSCHFQHPYFDIHLCRAKDVQVELVMLDPYVRATLAPDAAGTFSATIKLPDVYGVFKASGPGGNERQPAFY